MKPHPLSYITFKRISGIFLSFFLFTAVSQAQSYTTSAGIRAGKQLGLTVNQRILPGITVEGIAQSGFDNTNYFHVLGKKHFGLPFRRVNVYMGGGVFMGTNPEFKTQGMAGVVGFEFTFMRVNMSMDFMPMANTGPNGGLSTQSALSIRYVLIKSGGSKQRQNARDRKRRHKHRLKAQKNRNRWFSNF